MGCGWGYRRAVRARPYAFPVSCSIATCGTMSRPPPALARTVPLSVLLLGRLRPRARPLPPLAEAQLIRNLPIRHARATSDLLLSSTAIFRCVRSPAPVPRRHCTCSAGRLHIGQPMPKSWEPRSRDRRRPPPEPERLAPGAVRPPSWSTTHALSVVQALLARAIIRETRRMPR